MKRKRSEERHRSGRRFVISLDGPQSLPTVEKQQKEFAATRDTESDSDEEKQVSKLAVSNVDGKSLPVKEQLVVMEKLWDPQYNMAVEYRRLLRQAIAQLEKFYEATKELKEKEPASANVQHFEEMVKHDLHQSIGCPKFLEEAVTKVRVFKKVRFPKNYNADYEKNDKDSDDEDKNSSGDETDPESTDLCHIASRGYQTARSFCTCFPETYYLLVTVHDPDKNRVRLYIFWQELSEEMRLYLKEKKETHFQSDLKSLSEDDERRVFFSGLSEEIQYQYVKRDNQDAGLKEPKEPKPIGAKLHWRRKPDMTIRACEHDYFV